MARGLRDLANWARDQAKGLDDAASRLAVIGTLAAVDHLAYITPVDTSEHLSNWQVTIGGFATNALPPHVPGMRGSTRGASIRATVAMARDEVKIKKPGDVIFISNLGPAIVALDGGSSKQFSGGFVARASLAFSVAVREATKEVLTNGK